MSTDPVLTLHANLETLAPVTRRAVESPAADGVVQIHTAGDVMSASLRLPDGRAVRIHSGRDPVAEADQFVEGALGGLPGGAPTVVIVIGPGLGYVLEAIERRAPDTKVIAIEPFPALAKAMLERRDWRDWIEGKRLTLLVGPDYMGAGDAGRLLDERAAASASIIEHPVVTREFPAEIARARAAAGHIVKGAQANAEARRMFAGRYLLNTLRNVPAIVAEADVSALLHRFAGVPAIVVAAGPSLDEQLQQLKQFEDRALIVSVDTALRPLQAAGIRPHLVVAVDPSELNARHLLGIDDTDGSWLVSEGSIDPRVLPEFAGRTFTFRVSDHQPWPWLRMHGADRGTLRAWGSVLTTAFDLACVAGCDPIVFVGADLAYTGGVHYCRGTMNEDPGSYETATAVRAEAFAKVVRDLKRATCEEPDIRGAAVMSTPQFVQFRDWLVSRAVEASPTRVLNATGAGILHGQGITQVNFAQMSWPAQPGGAAELRARLAGAWNASVEQRFEALQALERTLARPGGDDVPVEVWRDFAGDSISSEQITSCIDATWRTPPVITAQPVSAYWAPGWGTGLIAAASGGPQPTVHWQVSIDGGVSWSNVANANAAIYPLTSADLGKQIRAVFANSLGAATTQPVTITVAPSGVVNDFDGDGKPDILWRSSLTGDNVIWLLDGVTRTGLSVLEAVPDVAWTLVGTGDFTGRGKPDVLWRHSADGQTGIWPMDGVTERGPTILMEMPPDLLWTVVGTGDVNGDGKSDILWRHAVTGRIMVWYMDGMTPIGEDWLDDEPDLAWTIAGTGDFNGDGKPDILWRNSMGGRIMVWYMDGVKRTGRDWLAVEAEPTWTVVGTGDFNGDGKPDILWHDVVTGAAVVWHMDGVRRVAVASLDTAPIASR